MKIAPVVCVAIALSAGSVVAQPAPKPPSKTLERAIVLYDKKDFASSTVELHKVVSGETADAQAHVERAGFFLAKALVNLDLDIAALARFDVMLQQGGHAFRHAMVKWVLAIADEHEAPGAAAMLWQFRDDPDALLVLDDAQLALLYVHLGREAFRRDDASAAAWLAKVHTGSKAASRANLEAAAVAFRAQAIDDGIRFALLAADDRAYALDAMRTLVTWTRLLGEPGRAAESLDKIAGSTSPAASYAKLQRSRLAVEDARIVPALDLTPVATFDAVVLAATCGKPAMRDVVPSLIEIVATGRKSVTSLLTWDDNTEIFLSVARSSGKGPLIERALADPTTESMIGWAAAVDRELARLSTMDRAWQTTQIAAEVLQELTVQQALAQADAGKRIKDRLEALDRELGSLERILRASNARIAAGPDVATGFVVTAEACAGTAMTSPTAPIAASPSATPRGRGCAGCAGRGESGGGVMPIFAVAWVIRSRGASRRRRRRDDGRDRDRDRAEHGTR